MSTPPTSSPSCPSPSTASSAPPPPCSSPSLVSSGQGIWWGCGAQCAGGCQSRASMCCCCCWVVVVSQQRPCKQADLAWGRACCWVWSWTTQRVVLLLLVVTLTSKLQRFNVRATTSSSSITTLLLLGLDDATRRSMAKRIVCGVPSLMLVAISIPTWQETAAGFVVGMRLRVEPGACDSMVVLAKG